MSTVIKAQLRDRAGKGAARAVRRENLTPAVVYGAKKRSSIYNFRPTRDHACTRIRFILQHYI